MATVGAGRTIAGRYLLRRTIGSGGMADVYLALDERLGRDVAVKLLHPGLASDPAFVERFRREAQNAASLNHPNIVSVYDWGSDDGTYYLVMEHVTGSTLKDVILHRGRRPEREALEISAEIASALDAAHGHGVVHRDVKPQNVLLDTEGGVKVGDFGIARATGESELTRTGTMLGSAHYASPEQIERRPVDARSDVYSLGAVMYELLTGRAPFVADSALAVAWQHVHETPQPLTAFEPGVSESVEAIVLKALQKDPDTRHQTAAELMTEIRTVLDGRPVRLKSAERAAPPVGPVAVSVPVAAHDAPTIALRTVKPLPQDHHKRPRRSALPIALAIGALLPALAGVLIFRARPAPGVAVPPANAVTPGATVAAAVAGVAATVEPPQMALATTPPPSPDAVQATPRPTLAPAPPTVPPPSPSSPVNSIGSFYTAAAEGKFSEAAGLWSSRMRAQYPPTEFIDQRFAQTHSLALNTARVVEQTAERAVVAVDLTEVIGNPPEVRRWVGTWTLVRSGSGWLMDAPNLAPG